MSDTKTHTHNQAETALAQAFEASSAAMPGSAAVSEMRRAAFNRFSAWGLPTRRLEAWHYSDLRSAMSDALPLASAPEAAAIAAARGALAQLPASTSRIVLVDGFFSDELSTVDTTVSIENLDSVLGAAGAEIVDEIAPPHARVEDGALALNAALMSGGVVVDISPGIKLETPLEIVCLATRAAEQAIYSRSMVRAGSGCEATVVERHISIGGAQTQINDALVLHLAESAKIDHLMIGHENGTGLLHVNSLLVTVGAVARFKSFGLLDHGAFVRKQIFSRFNGADASLELAGLALVRGRDHVDTTLVVEHRHPGCRSSEYFKYIVEGAGTGVFQGRISVAAQAQKTDGAMKSQAILLSDDAAMYNKPELEIFADDVACGHGATCGSLDEDQLFYTMARGIPRVQAEALLLEAFGADAIDGVENEAFKEALVERLRNWLAGRQS